MIFKFSSLASATYGAFLHDVYTSFPAAVVIDISDGYASAHSYIEIKVDDESNAYLKLKYGQYISTDDMTKKEMVDDYRIIMKQYYKNSYY